MGPGDEALPGLSAGDRAAGGVCALRVPRQSEDGQLPELPAAGPGEGAGVPGSLSSQHLPCADCASLNTVPEV